MKHWEGDYLEPCVANKVARFKSSASKRCAECPVSRLTISEEGVQVARQYFCEVMGPSHMQDLGSKEGEVSVLEAVKKHFDCIAQWCQISKTFAMHWDS